MHVLSPLGDQNVLCLSPLEGLFLLRKSVCVCVCQTCGHIVTVSPLAVEERISAPCRDAMPILGGSFKEVQQITRL